MSTRDDWKNTILAGLANYIDGGSIVSGSAALAVWATRFHLSAGLIGLLGAFRANAISAGVGAFIGGRICDLFGRKKIYQYDMLFYAFGMAWLVFAVQPWMIVVGFIIVGLAVGADIPASWSLIAELAPSKERGMHSGVAQVLWYLGPVVVLLMFLWLAPLGVFGARIVFAQLAVVALVLTLMRSGMKESALWEKAQAEKAAGVPNESAKLRALFTPQNIKAMLFLISMYGIWNLWAGTNGFFFPYILRTVGAESQAARVAMQAGGFVVAILSLCLVFMRFSDRASQRTLIGISSLIQIFRMSLFAIFPLTTPVAVTYLILVWFGSCFGAQSFFQLWSA